MTNPITNFQKYLRSWPTPSPQMSLGGTNRNLPSPGAFNAGAPSLQFFPQTSQKLPSGFPGWSSVTGIVPSYSMQPDQWDEPGGLLGPLREHLRNSPY